MVIHGTLGNDTETKGFVGHSKFKIHLASFSKMATQENENLQFFINNFDNIDGWKLD